MVHINGDGTAGELAVYRQLQKSFKTAGKEVDTLNTILQQSSENNSSLTNLVEQMQCCRGVKLTETPLDAFPTLQDRLEEKIVQQTDYYLGALYQTLKEIEAIHQEVSKQTNASFDVYKRYKEQLTTRQMTASSYWPSIATMLEWLTDMDETVYNLFCEKKYILKRCTLTDAESMDLLVKKWPDDWDLQKKTSEKMLCLSTFLKEKI